MSYYGIFNGGINNIYIETSHEWYFKNHNIQTYTDKNNNKYTCESSLFDNEDNNNKMKKIIQYKNNILISKTITSIDENGYLLETEFYNKDDILVKLRYYDNNNIFKEFTFEYHYNNIRFIKELSINDSRKNDYIIENYDNNGQIIGKIIVDKLTNGKKSMKYSHGIPIHIISNNQSLNFLSI